VIVGNFPQLLGSLKVRNIKVMKVGDYILTEFHKDKKLKVTKKKTGFKKDCFDTDIGERYFLDNRFNSWTKVKKNEKQS
jgi:hypothetical protein